MGYSTEFKGEIKFNQELTASQLAEVRKFLGEDCRDHPEWGAEDLYHVDLEFNDDFSGLRWDGAEKTYNMVGLVNMIVSNMRSAVSGEFGFVGEMVAQGEDYDDRWTLVCSENGWAARVDVPLTGKVAVECPRCEEEFLLDEARQRKVE